MRRLSLCRAASQTAPQRRYGRPTHAALSSELNRRYATYETRSPPSLSRPSLTLPTRPFSLMPYRCARSPVSQRTQHYFCSADRISSQMSSSMLGHCHFLTSTAWGTLAERARLRLLIRPLRSTNEPVDKFFMERLSRPLPWVAPRACATSARLTAR